MPRALWLLAAFSTCAASQTSDQEALTRALVDNDECNTGDGAAVGACGIELLHLRAAKKQVDAVAHGAVRHHGFMGFSSLAEYEAYEAEVDDIIEDAFAKVRELGSGGYLQDNVKHEEVWRVCSNIDWTSFHGKPGFSLDQVLSDMKVENVCHSTFGKYREDPTCIAIQAAAAAFFKLQKRFKAGPKFVNYLLVNWGEHPSWAKGSVIVNNRVMPPDAKVLDGNAANGYAFCDMVRTVVTESADQLQTGTCGFVASLAALSHAAPAKLIRSAVRLIWTGRPTRLVPPPCDYIFALKPGLVPFIDATGAVRPSDFKRSALASACVGNGADCQMSVGRPLQNAGLTFMWSQSLIASYGHAITGSCPQSGPARLNYPGLSDEGRTNISMVQGQSAGSSLWACNAVIDPQLGSCNIKFNLDICGSLPDNECQLLMAYEVDRLQKSSVDSAFLDTMDELSGGNSDIDAIRQMFNESKAMWTAKVYEATTRASSQLSRAAREYATYLSKLTDLVGIDAFFVTMNVFTPSANEEVLDKACRSPIAMLAVDAEPLQGNASSNASQPLNGPYEWSDGNGRCNHMVYLASCDTARNVYTLWTWGTRKYVTKELLLGNPTDTVGNYVAPRKSGTFNTGIVCFATYASQITWAPGPGEPQEGVRRLTPRHAQL